MIYPGTLLHYGKRHHIGDLIRTGKLSFGLGEYYENPKLAKGQQDNEAVRIFSPPSETYSISVVRSTGQRERLPSATNLKIRHVIDLPYFMFCCAAGTVANMDKDMKADMFIEISSVPMFLKRVQKAVSEQLPGWRFYSQYVEYWEMNRPITRNNKELMFLKDAARFMHQKEYRLVLIPENLEIISVHQRQELQIGTFDDIACDRKLSDRKGQ